MAQDAPNERLIAPGAHAIVSLGLQHAITSFATSNQSHEIDCPKFACAESGRM
jgi:hypothetical protein